MSRYRPFFAGALALFLLACSNPGQSTDNAGSPDTQSSVHTLLELHNTARANDQQCAKAVPVASRTLVWNSNLAAAAERHARDLNRNTIFAHRGSDGSSAADRINETGYLWAKYGENIATGQTTAQATMQTWLDSPLHCANLMDPEFNEFGASMQDDYWVVVFAKRRDW